MLCGICVHEDAHKTPCFRGCVLFVVGAHSSSCFYVSWGLKANGCEKPHVCPLEAVRQNRLECADPTKSRGRGWAE